MFHHLVMFSYFDGIDGRSREEQAEAMRDELLALPSEIAELGALEVRLKRGGDCTADLLLNESFRSEADYRAYSTHPRHLLAVAKFKKAIASRVSFDWESEN